MKGDEELLELIDQQSLALSYAKSSDDIEWLDQLFWSEVSRLAKEAPEKLAFIFSEVAVQALASSSDMMIKRLVSRSITSFCFDNKCMEGFLFSSSKPCCEIVNHRFSSLASEYITLAKQTANEAGVMQTTQVFSVKAIVANKLKSCTRSMLYGIADRMGKPVLRFEEALLLQILTASDQEVPALKFKKAQQCLSSGEASEPIISQIRQENLACYNEDDSEGRANISLNKELYARSLLVSGHLIKTVGIETGLTLRQVRRINENVRAAKYEPDSSERLRATRSSNMFIQTSADMLQVSVAMCLYANLGGDDIHKTTDMLALNAAFSIYCTIRHDIFGVKERMDRTIFLPDMWVLAVELRSNHASYSFCDCCNTQSFLSVNQRTVNSECPFHKPTVAQRALTQLEL